MEENNSDSIAELFRKNNPEIPSNCVFNKVVTGCGATSLEIENLKRDSIIVVPFRSMIENKVGQYPNKRTPEDFELFGVYAEVGASETEDYFRRNHGKKNKIMVTWDSFPSLIEWIANYNRKYEEKKPTDIEDYFLLIDEVHAMLNNYLFRRDAIEGVLRNYRTFKNWCFLTATPHGDDFVLEELTDVPVIVAEEMVPEMVTLKNTPTNRLEADTEKIIKDHFEKSDITNAHIFVNSVKFIEKIVVKCQLTTDNCKIVWGKDNELFPDDIHGITRGKPEEAPKKINFYTSTCFEGCDIYDENGRTYIISDAYRKHTLSDVHTTFRQITGRIRNTRYKSPIIHLYRKCIYSSKDLTYEVYKEQSERKVGDAIKIAQTYNDCLVFNEEEEILNKHYITCKYSKENRFSYEPNLRRHDLLNYKITHDDYIELVPLMKAQEGAGMIPKAIKVGNWASDEIDGRTTLKGALKDYKWIMEHPGANGNEKRIKDLFDKYFYLEEAYRKLKPKWLENVEFNTQKVQRALDLRSDEEFRGRIQEILLEKLRNLDIHVGEPPDNFISNEQCKDILKEAYDKVGIGKRKMAKGTQIKENYFDVEPVSISKDGERIHGYLLNGLKTV